MRWWRWIYDGLATDGAQMSTDRRDNNVTRHNNSRRGKPRVAEEIMSGMREIQKMMDQNRRPEETLSARTIGARKPRNNRVETTG